MSSYLLLRNNKESGPFTMDEIKGMSLKAYDLLWVVGKSAAWCYPGEIPEFKSFAPPVPEQDADLFCKQQNADNPVSDSGNNKKSDSANTRSRESNTQRVNSGRSVYVNLPAEKKTITIPPARVSQDAWMISSYVQDPTYDFSDLYKKQPTRVVRFSGNVLWVSTIALLFGAGVLTGLFISDRRKFFSTDANHPQKTPAIQTTVLHNKKEISPVISNMGQENKTNDVTSLKSATGTPANPVSNKLIKGSGKKSVKNNPVKNDSLVSKPAIFSNIKLNDSLKQTAFSKTDALYQKIKAHPENYLNLVTGRYSTGMFGGVSSFPVTVTNNSPVTMDMVVVSIDYIQNNEKVFKTEILSFNALEPGEAVTMKAPKSPRGVKISTHIQVMNARQADPGSSN